MICCKSSSFSDPEPNLVCCSNPGILLQETVQADVACDLFLYPTFGSL